MGFGLGKTDSVRLYNSEGTLIDEVAYESETPWPSCADETGNTLELINPDLDNLLAENWGCVNTNGSPNAVNSTGLSVEDNVADIINIYPKVKIIKSLYQEISNNVLQLKINALVSLMILQKVKFYNLKY